jgi:hypothetical protein
VYHTPSGSVVDRANLSSSLSRSLEPMAISATKGTISSSFHLERVKKRSAKRAAGSTGSEEAGKYVSACSGSPRARDWVSM